jgi:hypothetical protein
MTRKEKELASDLHHETFYKSAWEKTNENDPQYIDLKIDNLPRDMDDEKLKSLVNVKHVVSANTEIDTVRGTCNGVGRVRFRISAGEDPE